MANYIEKEEKLNLVLSEQNNNVKVTVTCFNGTIASIGTATMIYNAGCGHPDGAEIEKTEVVGTVQELKDERIRFSGNAVNPDGLSVRIEHEIFEENGQSITYTFPDDYTGAPDFDSNDESVDYEFFINMR